MDGYTVNTVIEARLFASTAVAAFTSISGCISASSIRAL
jgi:hypothetical protein